MSVESESVDANLRLHKKKMKNTIKRLRVNKKIDRMNIVFVENFGKIAN